MKYKIILILLYLAPNFLYSQAEIRNIIFDRKEVFDSTQKDWFFAGKLANKFHWLTQESIIKDELLFNEKDTINYEAIDESERNLRKTRLFTKVKIELDSVSENVYDVYVVTQDQWSLKPAIAYGSGGGISRLGGQIEESNIFGYGGSIFARALYRNENSIGWEGAASFNKTRIFGSEYSISANIVSHKYKTDQYLTLQKPFRTTDTRHSYGLTVENAYGYDWRYFTDDGSNLMAVHNRNISLWYSLGFKRVDRNFVSVYFHLEDVNRGKDSNARAFDNSGRFLIAFSSLSQDYVPINKVDGWDIEDMPIGGWGSAVLGKTFAVGHKGENLYYLGAQAEKSAYYNDKIYLFAHITSGSGFSHSMPKYTYMELLALGFYRINKWATLCARIYPQGSWSWESKLRQLIIDNDAGLRGYKANNIVGANRIISNIEMRLFPDYGFWIFKLGGAAFYDVGATWAYGSRFLDSRFHSSAGLGLRFFNLKGNTEKAIFRLDFAYNFDERKVGIIFNTDQLFKAFGNHDYQIPNVYGLDFDEE